MRKLLILLLSFISFAVASEQLAPGYGSLGYPVAPAGSYELYDLGLADNGKVLTANNKAVSLYELFDNKVVVLGFVYLSCSDVNGCPLTTFVVSQVKDQAQQISSIAKNVRLLSLSFDPSRDTPEVLNKQSKHIGADNNLWSLLTTNKDVNLNSILSAYNQPIQKIYDKNGKETGEINHILRVFLIDKYKRIRNIYSNVFLHRDILLSDIKTLLLEENPQMSFEQK